MRSTEFVLLPCHSNSADPEKRKMSTDAGTAGSEWEMLVSDTVSGILALKPLLSNFDSENRYTRLVVVHQF